MITSLLPAADLFLDYYYLEPKVSAFLPFEDCELLLELLRKIVSGIKRVPLPDLNLSTVPPVTDWLECGSKMSMFEFLASSCSCADSLR